MNSELQPFLGGGSPSTAQERTWKASPRIQDDLTPRSTDTKVLPGLVHFNRARRELELATTVDEVKQIRDKAEAMRTYARQAKYSLEMQNMCAEIKIRAERKLGEMLRDSRISESGTGNLLRGRIVRPRDNTPSLAELGISKSQSSRLQMISDIAPEAFEERIEQVKSSGKELTSREMVDYARYLQRDKARSEERESAIRVASEISDMERVRIVRGDFREALSEPFIESGSVDLIVTDPPYGKAHLPLWKELSRFAARALKPGKLLVTYSGNYYLPEVMRMLGEHLQYVWTAALMNGTPPDTVFPRKIMTCWKPILLFSRGDYSPPLKSEWFKDRIEGDGRNKAFHDWQQGVGEAEQIIEYFTFAGDLVVDPFLGSGTNGVASTRLQRRFVGCDIDENAVGTALNRIGEVV